MKLKDLYKLQTISGCHFSASGKKVVYALNRIDKKTEKKYCNLQLIEVKTGKTQSLTKGDFIDVAARFSPDCKWVAFLSNRTENKTTQLFRINIKSGKISQLTHSDADIQQFSWSPSGRQIALQTQAHTKSEIKRRNNEAQKALGVVEMHYKKRPFFKSDGMGYNREEANQISVLEIKNKKIKNLTLDKDFTNNGPIWSPCGNFIAWVGSKFPDCDLHPGEDEIYCHNLEEQSVRKLPGSPSPKWSLTFSPDGKQLAWIGNKNAAQWWSNCHLYLQPFDGSSEPEILTENLGMCCSNLSLGDVKSGVTDSAPIFTADGRGLIFQYSSEGHTYIGTLDIATKTLWPTANEPGVCCEFYTDASRQQLLYVHGSFYDPMQIKLLAANGQTQNLTQLNKNLLQNYNFGDLEELRITLPDGETQIHGWVLKPPQFDPEKQYPSVLQIHGGPWLQFAHAFMHEFLWLAAQGYVVHFCNPLGSKGYGEAFAKAIQNNWGQPAYESLMAWTDEIANLPYINPNQMGVCGGSYGGYMVNWIIGHTHRFKAAVTQRCVSNLVSFWGSSDVNWAFQQAFSNKPPFKDFTNYWRLSPIKYIANAKTPTLVMHSLNDYRCPIEQGEQVFVALKYLGVETELVLHPEESHGLSRNGRTDRRISRLKHIKRWLNKHLTE